MPVSAPRRLPRYLQALAYPGFRWLLLNGFVAGWARFLYALAKGWAVLELTDSPLWVGVASGLEGIGMLTMGLIGGVIADRFDRRWVIALTQITFAAIALVIAVLFTLDQVRVWHLLVIAWVMGAAVVIEMPSRLAVIRDLVPPGAVLNANAAGMIAMTLASIGSNTAGGLVIARAGLAAPFYLTGGLFLLAVAVLLRLKKQPPQAPQEQVSPLQQTREGLAYIIRHPQLRTLLLVSIIVETFGFSVIWMFPVFARDVLAVGATGLGFLTAAFSAGSLTSSILAALLGDTRAKGWLLVGTITSFGLCLVAFAASRWYPLSLVLIGTVGASAVLYDVLIMTLLMLLCSDSMRGRVMSVYVLLWGTNAVGGLFLGAAGSLTGVPLAVGAAGGLVALSALSLPRLARQVQRQAPQEVQAQPQADTRP